ncbi:hypothetical protein OSB04_029367 [Centaurea solstitialis]|uniref:Retrotransposon gag domain-containing protein n=1 Tax=Centaurea solstitialis TaxID=347529 RepID=A0AA38SUD3_9ASTR|nr:hypothetical protein OSB04_029367 [Centaurea solstitialis]
MTGQPDLAGISAQLADLMARLMQNEQRHLETIEKLDAVAATVQTIEASEVMTQPKGGLRPNPYNSDNDRDLRLLELPTGEGDPEDYLDWVRQVEKVFDYKGFDDQKSYRIAVLKLTKYAALWFENLKTKRDREEEPRIMTWSELKRHLKKRFLPREFTQDQFIKLNYLQQRNLSIAEYTKEFENLCMLCDLREQDEMKIARYIRGLNMVIAHKVQTMPYTYFEDVSKLAARIEQQEKEKLKTPMLANNVTPYKGGESNQGGSIQQTPKYVTVPNEFLKTNEKVTRRPTTTLSREYKEKKCFKCQGWGHIASQCGNRVTITMREARALMAKYAAEEEAAEDEERVLPMQETQDENEPDQGYNGRWQDQDYVDPPMVDNVLIIRKLLHTKVEPLEDEQRENLFQTRCLVNGRWCSMIIDSGSCTNVVSSKTVNVLKLDTKDHPKPYKLNWLNDNDSLRVKKQALVALELGGYKDEI